MDFNFSFNYTTLLGGCKLISPVYGNVIEKLELLYFHNQTCGWSTYFIATAATVI